jgi:hypothetical protein
LRLLTVFRRDTRFVGTNESRHKGSEEKVKKVERIRTAREESNRKENE